MQYELRVFVVANGHSWRFMICSSRRSSGDIMLIDIVYKSIYLKIICNDM